MKQSPLRRSGQHAIVCLLLAILFGCSVLNGRPGTVDERNFPRAADLYSEILHKSGQATRLVGTAKVRLHGLHKTIQLGGVIACSRDGYLRFEILDFWDHVVFLAILRREVFLTYSVADNEYFEGPADPAQLEKVLGIPLRGAVLLELMLGNPFFVAMENPRLHVSSDEEGLVLDAEDLALGLRYLVWVDPLNRPFRSVLVRSPSGGDPAGNLQVAFERYREIDSFQFPFRIRVSDTGNQEVLAIDYESVTLGGDFREELFQFTPPPDAERVTW